MAINSYATLQTAIANWLLRSDLTAVTPDFITLAEASLRRDPRVKRLLSTTLTVSSTPVALPTSLVEIESLSYQGSTNFGEIEIVSPGDFGQVMAEFGTTGRPRVAALLTKGSLGFAPAPDQPYTVNLTYWATIPSLGGGTLSNWLLDSHPDIYLYASLLQSAPYLKDDARIGIWKAELGRFLDELELENNRNTYSGSMIRRVDYPIP